MLYYKNLNIGNIFEFLYEWYLLLASLLKFWNLNLLNITLYLN